MPRSMTGKGRHVSYNAEGELCMTVVDPVTRKLLIPKQYIFDTRAQQRSTLPSLCQLFLSGRCRQGQGCYQVHADWEAVQRLRARVDSLPCCCPDHGDKDHLGVLDNAPLRDVLGSPAGHYHNAHANLDVGLTPAAESGICARDIVLYVPGCSTYEGNYVPLERVSYTLGLRRLLEEQHVLMPRPTAHVSLLNPETGFPEDKVVADASGATVCRLHAMDRCRYAEECKFLHLCKELTTTDPQLTASPSAVFGEYAAPESSFDPSVTSAAMNVTTGVSASATSMDRRGKDARSSAATGPRQSVFTSISLQQHQNQSSPGVIGGSNSFSGRPLLVPQGEEVNTGTAVPALQGTPMPFLPMSLPSNHAAVNAAATPTSAAVPPMDTFMGSNQLTAGSVGSFPGGNNSYSSPTTAPNAYGPNNGRIRVSLSLSVVNSLSNVNNATGLGMSNSSDKTSTPVDDTLASTDSACVDPCGATSLSNCGLTRSMPQGFSSSLNPTRWHHNPYGPSLPKCEVPTPGSHHSLSCVNSHPGSSGMCMAMTH